ncbi:hypothetical protein D3C75_1060860 [compost metagenome]
MHHASHPRTPTAFVAMTDCWTGLAPLVYFETRPTPPPLQTSRTLAAATGRLRRLLRLIA